jgi:2-polyprenyl-6-methoxyphenol hydroxylase-like FAD-dependent oxidoreductase
MADEKPVLVIGAGPVGLTMAAELARLGVAVRIVDKAAARTDKSKALVVWSRTLELIEPWGWADRFLATGISVGGARISTGEQLLADITLDAATSRFRSALMIPQSETERLLEERLAELGVKAERRVEMTSFKVADEGVVATLRHADGKEETVSAEWMVGCDGAHSAVRHGLGMEFSGTTEPSDWLLADIRLTGLRPDKLDMFWHTKGLLAFFPMGGDRYRAIADVGVAQDSGHRADPTLEEVQALIDQRGPGNIRLHDPYWLTWFRINERKVKDYSQGPVFLAGDAAHIHGPAGGQGMNTGMQDVFNLAWKLAMVIRGTAKPSLLDSYSIERSAVGEIVLRNAGRLTHMAIMRNPVGQAVRNFTARFVLGLSQVQHRMSDTLTELDIAYPESPLSVTGRQASGSRKAGERWPPIELPGVGAGPEPRFTVVGDAAVAARLAQRFPALLRMAAAGSADGLWIVRPDGYVGLAAAGDDAEAAERYLSGIAAG